jgi:hypothetical protein
MNLVPPSNRPALLSRLLIFLSALLDALSFFFLCLSFSNLTHFLHTWCIRLLAEESSAE